jgi:hypothetical protein
MANSASSYLADTLEHIDGRAEVANVEHRQRELDEAIVTDTVRVVFMTGRADATFLVGTLAVSNSSAHTELTMRASSGPPGAVVRDPSSWFLYSSGMVTSTSDTRTMSFGANGWN